jgi:hypothetical protein
MSFRVAESLLKFRSQIDAMAPGRDKSNDGTIGDTSHQARKSDHNPNSDGVVTAIDITNDPAHGVNAGELAELLRLSKDSRIKYVISNRRIFSSQVEPWQWRPYNGANAHTHHVHLSVVGDKVLYDDTRSWPIEPRAKVVEPPQERGSRRCTNITATVFGGASEFELSRYDGHVIGEDELGVALPFFFRGPRPKVRVINPATGKSVVCDVVDLGPWNTNDPYWETGSRPQAESGIARDGRKTNLAGIDLTPATARAVGIDGKGQVDWEFASPSEVDRGPQIMVDGLMQRLEQLERLITARRGDTPFRPPGDLPIIRPPGDLTIFRRPGDIPIPTDPNDIGAWLERLVTLVGKLQAQGTTTIPSSGSPQTEQLRKALEVLTAIMAPGTDGKPGALGQVNGALGQTLGNLLNGKKTAIGVIGSALTPLLSAVPAASGLGKVLALLTPAIVPATVGLSPFVMPIFLAIAAWGILGKFEKWAQGTAPPPKPTK